MKSLTHIDRKDYDDTWPRIISNCVRAIIVADNKIALLYSQKYKIYLMPGGKIDKGETEIEALIREVKEEAGLVVIPKSINEFGRVTTVRRGMFFEFEGEVYDERASYYTCDVEDVVLETDFTESEKRFDFSFGYFSFEQAILANELAMKSGINWIDSETYVLKLFSKVNQDANPIT